MAVGHVNRNLAIVLLLIPAVSVANFVDGFEGDEVGSFPGQWEAWTPGGPTMAASIVDEVTDPGRVFSGGRSARLTFTGGYGSGIITSFDPVQQGELQFHSLIDSFSGRVVLMTLLNAPEPELPGVAIANIQVMQGFPNYFMKVGPQNEVFDTGVPIVLGEYVEFNLQFDTFSDTATLLINDNPTNAVNVPFLNPSDAVVAMNSSHTTEIGGFAQWYLDDVSVVPEPSIGFLMVVGVSVGVHRRGWIRS